MYPKNPDGMCSGPGSCKIDDIKADDLQVAFFPGPLLDCV